MPIARKSEHKFYYVCFLEIHSKVDTSLMHKFWFWKKKQFIQEPDEPEKIFSHYPNFCNIRSTKTS